MEVLRNEPAITANAIIEVYNAMVISIQSAIIEGIRIINILLGDQNLTNLLQQPDIPEVEELVDNNDECFQIFNPIRTPNTIQPQPYNRDFEEFLDNIGEDFFDEQLLGERRLINQPAIEEIRNNDNQPNSFGNIRNGGDNDNNIFGTTFNQQPYQDPDPLWIDTVTHWISANELNYLQDTSPPLLLEFGSVNQEGE